MRLFFAVLLPPEIQAKLGEIHSRLSWLPIRAAWTAANNFHLTLKFLGDVPDDGVMVLVNAVRTLVHVDKMMALQLDHLLYFPDDGATRVLSIGASGDVQPLVAMQSNIETICTDLGFPRESRAYMPHATLARFRDELHDRHKSRIQQELSGILPMPPVMISQFQLMQSVLGNQGPRYAMVSRFSVG